MKNIKKNTFCGECRTTVPYTLKKVIRAYEINGKNYNMEVTAAFCEHCGAEINIPGILDLRLAEIDAQYRQAENIISLEDIKKLASFYLEEQDNPDISLHLQKKEIERYMLGQVPAKEKSDIMKEKLCSLMSMKNIKDERRIKRVPSERFFEDENGYVYPFDGGYKVFWKKEELRPDVDIIFSRCHEAYYYLRSVNK